MTVVRRSHQGQHQHCSVQQVVWGPVSQHLPPACLASPPVVCVHLVACVSQLLTPMSVSTDEFVVEGPSDPVVAVLGADATLPCFLFPPMSAVTMEQRGFRTEFSSGAEVVLSFWDQQEQKEEQMAQYAGRASLVRDLLTQGEAAVRIHNVRVSDNGLYTCSFSKGGFYEAANLELKVAGVGSAPQVHIRGPEEDGVRVVCTASGWFPKPQVQWRDLRGEKLLLHVQQERKKLPLEKEEAQQAKEEALKASGERKAAYLAAWRKAQLYGDWRKEQFQALAVTLDLSRAHPKLAVSQDRTSVTRKDTYVSSDDFYGVWGHEEITSGRCYWEVEIRDTDSSEWALGIHGEDAKDQPNGSGFAGFWVVGRSASRYYAITKPVSQLFLRQPPHRVGIFLDYSEGDVSFYNMTDGSHMFSFPPASFSGTLFPYFMLKSGDVSMTICSTVGGPEESSVPLSNSSSLEPIKPSPPGELAPLLGTDSGAQLPSLP
ncbi:LOW QUALITY PROTEIN: butyrophilin subfamily 3 member A3-like [Tupaia chinensis]|uniref:LOW QUALITY PROTEIN: butyrophilin subfamily 3 member A3-like n=1 Tax=Tupaia chinensis TaxID=246437 RepID=UPI000FFCC23F|nr:LOW QUALITY PROTEIN: butyrophilin subfamily 3 member A3-like [Tupaia chinensis]